MWRGSLLFPPRANGVNLRHCTKRTLKLTYVPIQNVYLLMHSLWKLNCLILYLNSKWLTCFSLYVNDVFILCILYCSYYLNSHENQFYERKGLVSHYILVFISHKSALKRLEFLQSCTQCHAHARRPWLHIILYSLIPWKDCIMHH